MSWHRLIRLVAVLGVLLHAGLLVRHNGAVLAGTLGQGLAGDLVAAMCHPGGEGAAAPDTADGTDRTAKSECPICQGMSSAGLVLPAPLPLPARTEAETARLVVVARNIAHARACLPPPARGPPVPLQV